MNEETSVLEKKAIEAALKESWQLAVSLNESILRQDQKNIPALNRLAHSLSKLGDLTSAKKIYHKVLELDSNNTIAIKNLNKINNFGETQVVNSIGCKKMTSFLEEPGKTKVVKLVRLASDEILARLIPGQQVFFLTKKRSICIVDDHKVYLGTIPDDLSLRLIALIEGGNLYEVYIKSEDKQNLMVFIQETFRSERFHNQPSFTASSMATMAYLEDKSSYAEKNYEEDINEN